MKGRNETKRLFQSSPQPWPPSRRYQNSKHARVISSSAAEAGLFIILFTRNYLSFRLLVCVIIFTFILLSDCRALKNVLQACKKKDSKTANQTHATIVVRGYGSYPFLLTSLLSFYIRCDCTNYAYQLFDKILNRSHGLVSLNLVVESCMKDGECDIAKWVFRKMSTCDAVAWNSMIGGFVRNGRYEDALRFFEEMLINHVEPDGFTFASVITACARIGALTNAQRIHSMMIEKKIDLNFILSAALIDMYSKCGKIQTAKEIFDFAQRNDVSIWNAMINGFALHGLASDAIRVFSKMELENFFPDAITFIALLTACSHCGLVEQGRKYFYLMTSRHFIQPQVHHYGAMVDLFGRAGLLEECYALIKSMPMEPDVVIWRALLSACRLHRKPELGEVAVANISGLKSGDYVLLSNMYCSLRRWNSAESVRETMKKQGVRKTRGRSWIELMGVVQQFKASDQSHPETKAVYRILEGLVRLTKLEGFISMTEIVLMDVSEEEKEENLNFHSEKLALAYGILKTSPGTEIRISKNLRICHDCHCWIKLVSKVLSRVIIVRDRLRFHHFKGGICSCGDYW